MFVVTGTNHITTMTSGKLGLHSIYHHIKFVFLLVSLLFLLFFRATIFLQSLNFTAGMTNFHPTEKVASCLSARYNTVSTYQHGHLPKPFIHVGMPKTGTVSLQYFFRCGNFSTSHMACGKGGSRSNCARCMKNAIEKKLPPLASCGDFDAFTQMDNGKIYPQIEYLDEIHQENPNATFLIMFRDTSDWYKSLSNWSMGGLKGNNNLKKVIERQNITGLPPGKGENETELKEWFCNHVEYIRQFVRKHSSHALVEINITHPNVGEQLETVFGVSKKCWGQENKSKR